MHMKLNVHHSVNVHYTHGCEDELLYFQSITRSRFAFPENAQSTNNLLLLLAFTRAR